MGRSPKAFMERRLMPCTRNRLTPVNRKGIAQKPFLVPRGSIWLPAAKRGIPRSGGSLSRNTITFPASKQRMPIPGRQRRGITD